MGGTSNGSVQTFTYDDGSIVRTSTDVAVSYTIRSTMPGTNNIGYSGTYATPEAAKEALAEGDRRIGDNPQVVRRENVKTNTSTETVVYV